MKLEQRLKELGFNNFDGLTRAELLGRLEEKRKHAASGLGNSAFGDLHAKDMQELAVLLPLVAGMSSDWVATKKGLAALESGANRGVVDPKKLAEAAAIAKAASTSAPKSAGLAALEKLFEDPSRVLTTWQKPERQGWLAGFEQSGGALFLAGGRYKSNEYVVPKIDLKTGAETVFAKTGNVSPVAVRADGDKLYMIGSRGGAGVFQVFDQATGESLKRVTLSRPYNHVDEPELTVTPKGLVFGTGKHVAKLDPATGAAVSAALPKGFQGQSVVVDGDKIFVALASKSRQKVIELRLSDLGMERELFEKKHDSGAIIRMFTLGDRLYLADSVGVRVLDKASGKELGFAAVPHIDDVRPGEKPGDLAVMVRNTAFADGNDPFSFAGKILRITESELTAILAVPEAP